MGAIFLNIADVTTGYDQKQVLNGISLKLTQGMITGVFGHNGSGKSTLLKAVFGVIPTWSGKVTFDGHEITNLPSHRLVARGISLLPQGNSVFDDLTIQENLQVWASAVCSTEPEGKRIDKAVNAVLENEIEDSIFTKRRQDRAAVLSGGEKQLVALACALTQQPKLILMDEPSLGLSPERARKAMQLIWGLSRQMGISIILVEQQVNLALEVCDDAYVLRMGQVLLHESAEEMRRGSRLRDAFLS